MASKPLPKAAGQRHPRDQEKLRSPETRSSARKRLVTEERGGDLKKGRPFLVVGVGASAGGYEALTQLLKHIPERTGMAFVVVQHLDPSHESQLTELLLRSVTIPVVQIRHKMELVPDTVHVIPPNRELTLEGGVLQLRPRRKVDGTYMPIDRFFRSLADERGDRAIGIILSGSGTDGTIGAKALKGEGGITLAQDAKTAKFHGMPSSAISAGCIDFVLSPPEIAAELGRLASHPSLRPSAAAPGAAANEGAVEFQRILGLLRSRTGVDFRQYKHSTLKRRIMRRTVLNNLNSLPEYVHLVEQSPMEVDALFQDILINVTEFFRDSQAFETLKRTIFPKLLKHKSPDAPIRFWVPGCSTGEEAYSLAICAHEFLGKRASSISVQVFATDVSETALRKARLGAYPAGIASNVSPERLRRYFQQTDHGYQIVQMIRDWCVFARQNVGEDPPFSKIDLISCRNVLIYLESAFQKKVMPMFHYALNPAGYLMLGSSETVGTHTDLFMPVDKQNKIYLRRPSSSRLGPAFVPKERPEAIESAHPRRPVAEPIAPELKQQVDLILLSRYSPAGVVINAGLQVLHFRGQTGPYLEHSQGEASLDLLKMLQPGLAMDVRTALSQASKTDMPVRQERVHFHSNGHTRAVTIEVIPFKQSPLRDRFFLILFTEPAWPDEEPVTVPQRKGKQPGKDRATEREVQHLREEIRATKASLQTIIEEQGATNEELKSANEEIQSSNEELQSTNEELETAKEELQSTNEELTTLNEELQNRNNELAQVNNDLSNLITSFSLPILMLGNDLTIRRFTPMAEKVFNLIPSDTGRPVSDINPNLSLPDLSKLVKDVIESLNMRELDVQDRTGRWYSLRIRPYRTLENRIDGAVLVLIDIDEIKQGLAEITSMIRQPILILSGDMRVAEANPAFCQMFRTTREETEGRLIFELGDGQWNIAPLHTLLEGLLPEKNRVENYKIEHTFPNIGRRVIAFNVRRLYQPGKGTQLITLVLDDVTDAS
jgi:two-component system, chemotaxis family, CheB/CheR fusion protein